MTAEINLTKLQSHAGAASWQRGEKYYRENCVQELERIGQKFTARVVGSESYHVRITLKNNGDVAYECTCPVNEDGSCCKHIVAVALAIAKSEDSAAPTPNTEAGALKEFLLTQPQTQLVEMLLNFAENYSDIKRQLTFQQQLAGNSDLAGLKKAISNLLGRPRFLDYRKSREFSYKINELNTLLQQTLTAGKYGLCVSLCEYALERLIKLYAKSDDSAGYMGHEVAETGSIYQKACMAADVADKPKPANFLKLVMLDGWGIIPQESFQIMLGDSGYAELERKVEAEWANLKPATPHGYDAHRFTITSLMKKFAKQRGDIDFLIRIYHEESPYPHRYIKIVELCQQHSRQREAIQWAERGVKEHPNSNELRSLLAEMYVQDGLDAEALKLIWQNFRHSPSGESYMIVKQYAGAAWPEWREQALTLIIKAEQNIKTRYYATANTKPDCSLRAACLLSEGCIDEVRELLKTHDCIDHIKLEFARAIGETYPQEAAQHLQTIITHLMRGMTDNRTYEQVGLFLKEMTKWMPPIELQTYIEHLRQQYKAKKNLIKLLQAF